MFLDTGLAAFLARFRSAADLFASPYAGAFWESHVFGQIVRQAAARGETVPPMYWRTASGHEVDLVIERGAGRVTAIECKYKERPDGADAAGLRALEQAGKGRVPGRERSHSTVALATPVSSPARLRATGDCRRATPAGTEGATLRCRPRSAGGARPDRRARAASWEPEVQLAAVELVFTATARLSPEARHAALQLASNSLQYNDNKMFERAERAARPELFCDISGISASQHARRCN